MLSLITLVIDITVHHHNYEHLWKRVRNARGHTETQCSVSRFNYVQRIRYSLQYYMEFVHCIIHYTVNWYHQTIHSTKITITCPIR